MSNYIFVGKTVRYLALFHQVLDKIENLLCLKDSQGLGSYQSGREWLSDIEQLLPPIACSYADQREQR